MRQFKQTTLRAVMVGSCGLAVLGAGGVANAQVVASASEATTLGEVIVTAQRRSQRLEEVPAVVTALSAQTVERAGVVKFMDIAQLSSGVQMQKFGYTTQPAVRGVTSLTSGYGFENNVGIYIDGFYQPDSVAINGDLVNIRQVEILKGPQGTLYGRNATGGAILINTQEPSSAFEGNIQASYARFNDRAVQGYVSGPIGEIAGFSLAASTRRSDGWIRDLGVDGPGPDGYDAAPQKNDSIRAKLRVKPAEWATITFGYNYAKVGDAIGLVYTVYDKAPPTLPTPPLRATERDTATNNGVADNTAKLNEGTIRAEFKTGIGDLALRTSFGRRETHVLYDFDASKAQIFTGELPAQQDTYQQAVDYAITAIPNVDLLVGGLYFYDKINVGPQDSLSGGVVTSSDFTALKAKAFAGYVDATYHLDRLSLTAGVRYSHEDKYVSYYRTRGAALAPGRGTDSFEAWTPRFVARYEIAPRTNIYASYSKGFRSGVFQNQPLPSPLLVQAIEPEKITAYEVGFKTAHATFRFDAAAFFYDYSQLQLAVTIPNPLPGAVGVISTITNAKAAEVYGAEAQVTWSPISDLDITAGVTWLHGEYTDFANARGTGFNALTGLNATNQGQNWSGHQMARAPDLSATLQVSYGFDLVGGHAQLTANGNATSSYVVNNPSLLGPLAGPTVANKQRYRQSAYGIANLNASWTDPSDTYTATVFVTNVTNTRFKLVTSGGGFGDYRQYSQPRSAGVRLGYRF